MIEFLIVGAGLTGATIARTLTDNGKTCRVIDRRSHVAGNCYDEDWDGIRVNLYGGHIFHTNSARIWQFANRFTDWTPYEHRVKAMHQGVVYSFPPNRLTMQQLNLNGDERHAQNVLRAAFFAGYSYKQWGRDLASVPGGALARIKTRGTYDDRYFSDKYQGLPVRGYTDWIENMLFGIPVTVGLSYEPAMSREAGHVVFTGPLDALYNHCFGRLEYRSLRFEHERLVGDFQGCATMNYTDYTPAYTRILEWKHFGYHTHRETQITMEYPEPYNGTNEPYYPIDDDANRATYALYADLARRDGITAAGRLGQYRYYDMDQAIGAGLRIAEGLLNG